MSASSVCEYSQYLGAVPLQVLAPLSGRILVEQYALEIIVESLSEELHLRLRLGQFHCELSCGRGGKVCVHVRVI